MKKKELYVLIIIVVLCFAGMGFIYLNNQNKTYGTVYYGDGTVVLKFDINEDAYYTIKGDYGEFHLEVKDGKWRAHDVDCPNGDCEKMGWSSKELYLPIVCLPNRIWVGIDE